MPDATELVSLANLKTFLKITASGEDTILTAIKDGVEGWVKRWLDRDILIPSTAYTEYYDGDGTKKLLVRHYPITSITSIHADPARLFASNTEIPSSDFITGNTFSDNIGMIELYAYSFTKGVKSIKIIYKGGYSTIPDALQYAVKKLAAVQYGRYVTSRHDLRSSGIREQNAVFNMDAELPPEVKSILDTYRRPGI